MRAYVFTDKSLARYAGQFVWLSINTEDPKSANFLAKYPVPALPTLYVLDSSGEKIATRYIGGATVGQLRKLLDATLGTTDSSENALVASADKLANEGKHAEAAKLYESAIDKAPHGWPRYGRTAEALIFSLSNSNPEQCAARAVQLLTSLRGTVSGASVAGSGLSCAISLDEKNPQRGELVAILEKATRAALDDRKLDLSADDRSGLYISLIDSRVAMKDDAAAKRLRTEWASFLEKSAAAAKTAEQRAVYDSHRLSAYLDLGTPEKAIPMLQQSARDFRDDYNPHARMSAAYRAMKEYDKALAESDLALARAYGPRKVLILRQRADIYEAKGDKEGARKTIADAIAYAKQLPKEQVRASTIASLEKRLTALSQQ